MLYVLSSTMYSYIVYVVWGFQAIEIIIRAENAKADAPKCFFSFPNVSIAWYYKDGGCKVFVFAKKRSEQHILY